VQLIQFVRMNHVEPNTRTASPRDFERPFPAIQAP